MQKRKHKIVNFHHLREEGLNYFQHFGRSMTFAFWMYIGYYVAIIHAFFPFLFWKTNSNIIKKLYKKVDDE